jgi:hypothetical protein
MLEAEINAPCGVNIRFANMKKHGKECDVCANHVYGSHDVDEFAKHDKLDEFIWMYSKGHSISREGWKDLIFHNSHKVCQWLVSQTEIDVSYSDVCRAISDNSLDVLRIMYPLVTFDSKKKEKCLEMAIYSGDAKIVQFLGEAILREDGNVSVDDEQLEHFVKYDRLNDTTLTILWELGVQPQNLIEKALSYARENLVRFLMRKGQHPSLSFLSTFLHDSNTSMVHVLLDENFEFTHVHVTLALHEYNSIHTVLELVRRGAWKGKPMCEFTHLVVRLNKGEVLNELWDELEINEMTADYALLHADFGMIRMLASRGVLPSKTALHEIIALGHVAEVDFLLSHGMKPDPDHVPSILMSMHNIHDLAMFQILLENNLIQFKLLDLPKLPKTVLRFLHKYQCSACGKLTINKCFRCSYVSYCDEVCRLQDLKRHDTFCESLAVDPDDFTEIWN